MLDLLRVFSFWAIDNMSDIREHKKQLADIKAAGFDGVVFHPRRYDGNPEYMGCEYMEKLSELILYAKSIQMQFWLYDENGWPSGSANGEVIKKLPDLKCEWLECRNGTVDIFSSQGINSIDKRSVECFISLTHEKYKKELSKEAFDYVGGFFSDEVGFLEGHGACMDRGAIPWSDEIKEKYEKEFNDDIFLKLQTLFDESANDFKIWYWETLTELLSDNFYGTINKWCEDNGKLYTAHLKGEENPFFQIGYSGSAFGAIKNISVPGIDALERYRGNSFYPHIASSLARQGGRKFAMAEAIGGAGWGLEPQDVERYAQWLIKSGINLVIFHINQLHLTYSSITDWPSSIPCHEPWKGAFVKIIDNMKKLWANIKAPDTLLVCPSRGVMNRFSPENVKGMNEHNGANQVRCAASKISDEIVNLCERFETMGVDFDVTDEKALEDGGYIKDGKLYIGMAGYKNVFCSNGCIFSEKGKELLSKFKNQYPQNPENTEYINNEAYNVYAFDNSPWEYSVPFENRYFVEITDGKGNIQTEYISDFTLLVSDRCLVKVNGYELLCDRNDEYGYYYKIPENLLAVGKNTVELSIEKAYVYVLGKFSVGNYEKYFEFNERMLFTKNGFYIKKCNGLENNFILSGYMFSDMPITCKKTVSGFKGGYIKIDCKHIAAAKVYVDGEEKGWVYKGNEYIKINSHKESFLVQCEVYQSAYNIYGPHHYLNGDYKLISPVQFEGTKNFADDMSLPYITHDENMRFVKWEMSNNIDFSIKNKFNEEDFK